MTCPVLIDATTLGATAHEPALELERPPVTIRATMRNLHHSAIATARFISVVFYEVIAAHSRPLIVLLE